MRCGGSVAALRRRCRLVVVISLFTIPGHLGTRVCGARCHADPATFCATALYSHMPYTCIHTLLRWLMPHAQPLSTVRWALRGARDVRLRFIARRLPVSRSQALATGRTRSDTLLRTLLIPRPACTRRMTPPCAWSCRACAAAPAPTGFPGTHAHPTPPTHRASRRPRSCTRASQRRAPHRS